MKREDLIHPMVMGNKWRKLKYNLLAAREQRKAGLLTFGGAFSNHILATAAACRENNLRSIGIIRGQELNTQSNPTLQAATALGMELVFLPRSVFDLQKLDSAYWQQMHPEFLVLPEGGTNAAAIRGCAELVAEWEPLPDVLVCALGTGGTAAGVLQGLAGSGKLLIFPALKADGLEASFRQLIGDLCISYANFQFFTDYHFGGYGRVSDALINFINGFYQATQIPLDPIYTGKMMAGLIDLITTDFFPKGTKIGVIHTGGLQGVVGFNEKSRKKLYFGENPQFIQL